MSSRRIRKTHEEFINELFEVSPHIEVLGKYVGAREKVLVRCNIHNCEYSATPDNLLHGKGCKMCAIEKSAKSRRKDFNEIKQEFLNRGIELLTTEDEIVSLSKTKLRYICPFHGEQTVLWSNFKRGAGCRKCADEQNSINQRTDYSVVRQDFENCGYTLITSADEYQNCKQKLKYLCPEHGVQEITLDNLRQGERCRCCSEHLTESRLATQLKEYCKNKYSDTITEYKIIKNPETGKWLPYDIYIPSKKIYCEIMGVQHYNKKNSWFKSEQDFWKQWYRDDLKETYAAKHGRYVEIDMRVIHTIDQAINILENGRGWISNHAATLY